MRGQGSRNDLLPFLLPKINYHVCNWYHFVTFDDLEMVIWVIWSISVGYSRYDIALLKIDFIANIRIFDQDFSFHTKYNMTSYWCKARIQPNFCQSLHSRKNILYKNCLWKFFAYEIVRHWLRYIGSIKTVFWLIRDVFSPIVIWYFSQFLNIFSNNSI